ncbi:endo alpha-1,4 polygalactosaminidase [Leucobacter sp. UCMA 4100]|uniref:endo alpha-1,4 polygalactosaminidase n=1 Tax=Leucobacter sp. UCMA 4100 TaxID=2810534 RepID=UPI0022EA5E39|nr:endo alpha-1,4 polygalactosaminidase [Leucobacter sp. UCMA 4100]MDA3146324.1 endo alpha-1,4 polygalactosaminidase [Leucobacter sp. UCMA 4100]
MQRPTSLIRLALAGATLLLALPSCAQAGAQPVAVRDGFPERGVADYQLGGAYEPPEAVTIVERDSADDPAPGRYNICYVNGFQTQPADAEAWLTVSPSVVLHDAAGQPVFDPAWPDEMILDTSTEAKREAIMSRLEPVLAECAKKGFNAVEFDNLDTFSRFEGLVAEAGNLALASLLVNASHELGLQAGQKNTPQLGKSGRDEAGFDFAVAEECVRFAECEAYTGVYGKRVIDIEYFDDLRGSVEMTCADPARPDMTIVRDRDLVPIDNGEYAYHVCGE